MRNIKLSLVVPFQKTITFSSNEIRSGRSRGVGGLCHLAPFFSFLFFFFDKSEVCKQKINIKRVRNLLQNAGNGHFSDSNFQNILVEHAARPPGELCLRCSCPPPLPPSLKVLNPPLKRIVTYLVSYSLPFHNYDQS